MNKAATEFTQEGILDLVILGIEESSTIEYKGEMYESNEGGQREFLLDICSMANYHGGYIFVGIHEARDGNGRGLGIPDASRDLGIKVENPAQLLTACESRIIECIDERLKVDSAAVRMSNGRIVLVFRVPDSLAKPHRVFYRGRSYFPSRRERQRYELSASEIKDLAMRSATQLDKAESVLSESLTHYSLHPPAPQLTAALLPVNFQNFSIDLKDLRIVDAIRRFRTSNQTETISDSTYGIEGLTRTSPRVVLTLGHQGLLKISVELPGLVKNGTFTMHPGSVDHYTRFLTLGADAVYSLTNLRPPAILGARIETLNDFRLEYPAPFGPVVGVQRITKTFPTILVSDFGTVADRQIRPLLDVIHHSFGEQGSPEYDSNGDWRG